MTRVAIALATGFGSGYVPVAPGTVGSAVGLVVWLAARAGGASAEGLLLTTLLVLGVWSAAVTERATGRTDPGVIVIDEIVGMLVTVFLLPATWAIVLAGFLLFRMFDVVKPYPARTAERLPGGWGVVTDDVVAGLYAHLVLRGLLWALGGT